LIVCLPAIQSLIASGEPTYLVMRAPKQAGLERWIPGLAGWLYENEMIEQGLPEGARYINLREHPLQSAHYWGSPEFEAKWPGYRIADILAGICKDFGIAADFENPQPLPFEHCPRAAGRVLLMPGTAARFKIWRKDYWLQLAQMLTDRGIEFSIVGEPYHSPDVRELVDTGLSWLETKTLKDALNAVSSCRAVVSVDTGLMHLALNQGTPAVTMYINNPGYLQYERTVRHCYAIITPPCQQACTEEEPKKVPNEKLVWKDHAESIPWSCHAPDQLRCMGFVTPQLVLQTLEGALSEISEKHSRVQVTA
jgi:hypothetical protein